MSHPCSINRQACNIDKDGSCQFPTILFIGGGFNTARGLFCWVYIASYQFLKFVTHCGRGLVTSPPTKRKNTCQAIGKAGLQDLTAQ